MTSLFDGLPAVEPSSLTGFAGNRIDRRSEGRGPMRSPSRSPTLQARLYLFRGEPALVKTGDDPLFTAAEARALGADADTSGAARLERQKARGWPRRSPRKRRSTRRGSRR